MSLLLLFHPRAGGTPPAPRVVYEGRRPEPEDDDEMAIVLALFQAVVRGEDRTP